MKFEERNNTTVLVVDDEERIRRLISTALKERGYTVVTAADGASARALIDESFAVVLTDIKMPGQDGLSVLARVTELNLDIPVILMTAFASVDSAVAAMKAGAYDYIAKPFNLDELELIVGRAVEQRLLEREHSYLVESARTALDQIVGSSPAIRALKESIARVAVSRAPVLVTGETGSGKELVARAIHCLKKPPQGLLVPVNCAAIPGDLLESELFGHARGGFTGANQSRVGKFELANGGTLLLDEIGDMSTDLQSKLLRVLEDGTFERIGSNTQMTSSARIVSATNRDLAAMIATNEFRGDLYYRLNVLNISVPPLRERSDDIAALTAHFLASSARDAKLRVPELDEDSISLLQSYDWPGNVRELRNVCERLIVLFDRSTSCADTIAHLLDTPTSVPSQTMDGAPTLDSIATPLLADAVTKAESRAIRDALEQTDDNKPAAAQLLGISERTLWYKLKKLRRSE